MVRDSDLYSLGLVLIYLRSAITTPLSEKLRVDGRTLLHIANIFGVLFFIGYATVVLLRRYYNMMEASIN